MVGFGQQKHFVCYASSCFVVVSLKVSMFVCEAVATVMTIHQWLNWGEHGFVLMREVMETPFRCGVFSFRGKISWSNCISSVFTVIIDDCGYIDCWERRNGRCSQWFQTQGRDFFHSHLEYVDLGSGSADATGVRKMISVIHNWNTLLLSGNIDLPNNHH